MLLASLCEYLIHVYILCNDNMHVFVNTMHFIIRMIVSKHVITLT